MRRFLVLCSILSLLPCILAQDLNRAQSEQVEKARARLHDLQGMILQKEESKKELEQRIIDNPESEALQRQLRELTTVIDSLSDNFESIATGGSNIEGFYYHREDNLNWKGDIMEIARPLLDNLKKISKRPREIEKYRTSVARFAERRSEARSALNNLDRLKKGLDQMNAATSGHILELESIWQQHLADVERDLSVAEFKMDELMGNEGTMLDVLSNAIASFFKGRGRNLLLALLSAALTLVIMRFLISMFVRRTQTDEVRRQRISIRIMLYSLHLMSGLMVVGAGLLTLYLLGDWILMGVALIMLVGLAIRLRDWIPRFVSEMRLLLNLGTAREGERVIYHGLPWRVKSINLFSILENPLLRGGRLRLDLSQMQKLTSRPEGADEPWFPCKEGDWLLFDDGTHCNVLFQSPEVMHVRTPGGTLHIWQTAQLLAMKPMNLTASPFAIPLNLALDPRHWQICTGDEVAKVIRAKIREKFTGHRVENCFRNILVEFKEANLNALNFLVRLDMEPAADKDYSHIKRTASVACLEACLEQGWTLPANMIAFRETTNPLESVS